MKITEIKAKSILSKSQIYDYSLNPYAGCAHGCLYCYAQFVKKFTGHAKKWGEFVDIKINAPKILEIDIKKQKRGRVWISGVCDPYQPLEERYKLTRACLRILIENNWPVTIQTKAPLVLRDMDLLKSAHEIEVGLSISTTDERIRRIIEPHAPDLGSRIHSLKELFLNRITVFVMIAPILPGAEGLVELLKNHVSYVVIDRLNYRYVDRVYRRHGLIWAMEDKFFKTMKKRFVDGFGRYGIKVFSVF